MATLEQIQARMKRLQAEAEAIIAKRAQGALNQIRDLMLKHGLTTQDIETRAKARRMRAQAERDGLAGVKLKAVGATKGKLPPKYRDPKTGATWSGHARPPAWIKNVKDRSKFLIDGGSAIDAASVVIKAKPGRKPGVKKAVTGKAAPKKVAGKKAARTSTVAGKAAAKKATAKRTAPAAVKKATMKKVAAKKLAGKNGGRGVKRVAPARKTAGDAPAVADTAVAMS